MVEGLRRQLKNLESIVRVKERVIALLFKRNKELNVALMHEQAAVNDAQDRIRKIENEAEKYRQALEDLGSKTTGHNKCHKHIDIACSVLPDAAPLPEDPWNVDPYEMFEGCIAFVPTCYTFSDTHQQILFDEMRRRLEEILAAYKLKSLELSSMKDPDK